MSAVAAQKKIITVLFWKTHPYRNPFFRPVEALK
jgi:hypothetical protein